MNRQLTRYVLLAILACAMLTLLAMPQSAPPVQACGVAMRLDRMTVQVAEESAIILWDPADKMQHFIRRATFSTETPDFGFLVPTPARPSLSEAKDEAFAFLARLTAPEIVRKTRYILDIPIGCGSAKMPSATDGVKVLEENRVGGLDYAVLAADNAGDLNDWLGKNKYATRPDLTSWLEPYVKNKWTVTAFKIAKDAKREIATTAVCMSFKADAPMFPYSEPADQRSPARQHFGRKLQVFFLAERRYEGRLEADQKWPGKTVWAGAVPKKSISNLTGLLSPVIGGQHSYLTVFEDDSSPRPAVADVSFSPATAQDDVRRPTIIHEEKYNLAGWVCLGSVVLLMVTPPVLWTILRRKPQTAA